MTAPMPYFHYSLELHSNHGSLGRFAAICAYLFDRVSAACDQHKWTMCRPEPKLVRMDYTQRFPSDITLVALVNTHIPDALSVGNVLHVEFYFQPPDEKSSAQGYLITVCRSYPEALNRQMGGEPRVEAQYPDELFEEKINNLLTALTRD